MEVKIRDYVYDRGKLNPRFEGDLGIVSRILHRNGENYIEVSWFKVNKQRVDRITEVCICQYNIEDFTRYFRVIGESEVILEVL